MVEAGAEDESDILLSWMLHYDPLTKTKTPVNGYCVYLPSTREMHICINDPERGTEEEWTLTAQTCRATGVGKPVFVASNIDLGNF